MKIYNINPGTKLNITLTYKGCRFNAEATVLTQYGKGLLITPVYHDGKIIEYCSDATFEAVSPYSGATHKFCIDSLSRIDFSGTDFHVISGWEVVQQTNQRKAERFKLHKEATVTLENRQALRLVINDISIRGVSFLVGRSSSVFNIGDVLDIDFIKEGSFSHIKLSCAVVRKFKIGEYEAIGCELRNDSTSLVSYIQYKKQQKQELKDARMFEAVI